MFAFEHIKTVADRMTSDEIKLRRMLALSIESITDGYLYGDDGELQLQCAMPEGHPPMFIDFMRNSVVDIEDKLSNLTLAWYDHKLKQNNENHPDH